MLAQLNLSCVTKPLDDLLSRAERDVVWVKERVGKEPRPFVVGLVKLIDEADVADRVRIGLSFPEYVMAVECWNCGNLVERARHQGLFTMPEEEERSDEFCYGEKTCAGTGTDRAGLCWRCNRPRK